MLDHPFESEFVLASLLLSNEFLHVHLLLFFVLLAVRLVQRIQVDFGASSNLGFQQGQLLCLSPSFLFLRSSGNYLLELLLLAFLADGFEEGVPLRVVSSLFLPLSLL